jgi:uncharacterized protein DUF3617
MSVRLAAALVLTVAATTTALASGWSDFMHRRPGLWSVTIKMEGINYAQPDTKMCIDASTDAKMMEHSSKQQGSSCAPPKFQGMGSSHAVDMTCHMGDQTITSRSMMSFTGDTAYHMDSISHFSKPMMGKDSMHMVQDGKWLGACPPDMKPGDIQIGPVRMNVLTGGMSLPHGHLTKEQIQAMMKAQHQQ